jgi:hypothetical protein
MAQIANLVLPNGRATPVNVTFTPVMAALSEAKWSDKTSGRYIGLPTVALRTRIPVKGSDLFKITGVITVPTLETITNANASGYTAPPAEAYSHTVKFEMFCPARGSLIEREDSAAFASALFKDAQFLALVRGFEMPY